VVAVVVCPPAAVRLFVRAFAHDTLYGVHVFGVVATKKGVAVCSLVWAFRDAPKAVEIQLALWSRGKIVVIRGYVRYGEVRVGGELNDISVQ